MMSAIIDKLFQAREKELIEGFIKDWKRIGKILDECHYIVPEILDKKMYDIWDEVDNKLKEKWEQQKNG